ncbi:hypothetical protein FSP39_004065 [Pinctada imbricata]|uniref:Uncharacterized protein n=1 Tax=Pinctada imbricata TaxID=66713 RepID=A0AA88Y7A4_PINIB|nr:hypothetical protein FSP39_004065 [Pinctada imbricata]
MSFLKSKSYQEEKRNEKSVMNMPAKLQSSSHVRLKEKSKSEFFNVSKPVQKTFRSKMRRYKSDVDLGRLQRARQAPLPPITGSKHSYYDVTFNFEEVRRT